jgi:hypothetical protein
LQRPHRADRIAVDEFRGTDGANPDSSVGMEMRRFYVERMVAANRCAKLPFRRFS